MKKHIITFIALCTLTLSAHASLITIETRKINAGIDDTDFISSWNSQTTAISNNVIDEFKLHKPGGNTINRLTFDFDIANIGTWGFEAGLDAGYGASFFIDDTLIVNRTDNLWWKKQWNNSDVVRAHDVALDAGKHTGQVYWAENCCNGPSSVRFTTDGDNWLDLSTLNLESVSISEPASWLILASGMLAFGAYRKRKQSQ